MNSKLEAARATLGANWIGHPDYQFNPRHSNDPAIYGPARQPFLRGVAFAAQQARQTRQRRKTPSF